MRFAVDSTPPASSVIVSSDNCEKTGAVKCSEAPALKKAKKRKVATEGDSEDSKVANTSVTVHPPSRNSTKTVAKSDALDAFSRADVDKSDPEIPSSLEPETPVTMPVARTPTILRRLLPKPFTDVTPRTGVSTDGLGDVAGYVESGGNDGPDMSAAADTSSRCANDRPGPASPPPSPRSNPRIGQFTLPRSGQTAMVYSSAQDWLSALEVHASLSSPRHVHVIRFTH